MAILTLLIFLSAYAQSGTRMDPWVARCTLPVSPDYELVDAERKASRDHANQAGKWMADNDATGSIGLPTPAVLLTRKPADPNDSRLARLFQHFELPLDGAHITEGRRRSVGQVNLRWQYEFDPRDTIPNVLFRGAEHIYVVEMMRQVRVLDTARLENVEAVRLSSSDGELQLEIYRPFFRSGARSEFFSGAWFDEAQFLPRATELFLPKFKHPGNFTLSLMFHEEGLGNVSRITKPTNLEPPSSAPYIFNANRSFGVRVIHTRTGTDLIRYWEDGEL